MAITRFCLSSLYLLSHFRSSDVTTFDNGRHHAPILCLFVTKEILRCCEDRRKTLHADWGGQGHVLRGPAFTYVPALLQKIAKDFFFRGAKTPFYSTSLRSHFTHFRPHSYGANSGLHSLLALKKIGPEPKIGPGGSIMVSDIMVPRPY